MTDRELLQAVCNEQCRQGDLLERIFERLNRIETQLDALTCAVAVPDPRSASDLVDADYFVRITGLSRVTIRQGKAGTREVPLQSTRPKRWLKSDVDRWQRARASRLMPARQKAIRLLEKRRA